MKIPMNDICKLIGLQLGIRRVGEGDHLREDLGAESLDVQNIITALEDKYGISIDDDQLSEVTTVADCHKLVLSCRVA